MKVSKCQAILRETLANKGLPWTCVLPCFAVCALPPRNPQFALRAAQDARRPALKARSAQASVSTHCPLLSAGGTCLEALGMGYFTQNRLDNQTPIPQSSALCCCARAALSAHGRNTEAHISKHVVTNIAAQSTSEQPRGTARK